MGRQQLSLKPQLYLSFSTPCVCVCVFELTHTSCVAEWLGTGADLGDVQPLLALLCEGGPGRSLSRPTHLAMVEAPLLSPLTPGGCVFLFHSPSAFLSHSFSIDSEMEGQRS